MARASHGWAPMRAAWLVALAFERRAPNRARHTASKSILCCPTASTPQRQRSPQQRPGPAGHGERCAADSNDPPHGLQAKSSPKRGGIETTPPSPNPRRCGSGHRCSKPKQPATFDWKCQSTTGPPGTRQKWTVSTALLAQHPCNDCARTASRPGSAQWITAWGQLILKGVKLVCRS